MSLSGSGLDEFPADLFRRKCRNSVDVGMAGALLIERHLSVVDAVRLNDNARGGCLTEYFGHAYPVV